MKNELNYTQRKNRHKPADLQQQRVLIDTATATWLEGEKKTCWYVITQYQQAAAATALNYQFFNKKNKLSESEKW